MVGKKRGGFLSFFNLTRRWRELVTMLKDKKYKIPFARKLIYFAAIFYIIWPFDFIPEFIPFVGVVDDIGVLAFLIGLILYELDQYHGFLKDRGGDEEGPVYDAQWKTDEGTKKGKVKAIKDKSKGKK